jgi:hypothetical protein
MLNNIQVTKYFEHNPSVARGAQPERGNDVENIRCHLVEVTKPLKKNQSQ